MLEAIRSWTMVVSGVVLFGSLCEIILPQGAFQKYIKLGLGLLLVTALLSPLQRVKLGDITELSEYKESQIAYKQREDMEEEQREQIMNEYKRRLNQKIKVSIESRIKNLSAGVYCYVEEREEKFGEIQKVQVIVEKSEENVGDDIKEILERDYAIEKDRVDVRYLREKEE